MKAPVSPIKEQALRQVHQILAQGPTLLGQQASALLDDMPLEQMAALVEMHNRYVDALLRTSNEVNNRNRVFLGVMLNTCKRNVKLQRLTWERWAKENFPGIKSRTRQKIMFLGRTFGRESEKYFFLPLDTLYELTSNCSWCWNDPEFKKAAASLGLNLRLLEDDEEGLQDFKIKAQQLNRFFTVRNALKGVDYDLNKLIAAISTGCEFKSGEVQAIKAMHSRNKVNAFLDQMLATGTSPLKAGNGVQRQESPYSLLSKLIESLTILIAAEEEPDELALELIEMAMEKLEEYAGLA